MSLRKLGVIALCATTAVVLTATLAAFGFGVMLLGLSAFSGEAVGLVVGSFTLLLIEVVIASRHLWPLAARLWRVNG